MDDSQVDVVDICLPHSLHAPVAIDAAEAGKQVLCEKPIADSLEAADRMIDAAERAGVMLMVAENVRFSPLFHKIRNLLQDGVIGQPALIQKGGQISVHFVHRRLRLTVTNLFDHYNIL